MTHAEIGALSDQLYELIIDPKNLSKKERKDVEEALHHLTGRQAFELNCDKIHIVSAALSVAQKNQHAANIAKIILEKDDYPWGEPIADAENYGSYNFTLNMVIHYGQNLFTKKSINAFTSNTLISANNNNQIFSYEQDSHTNKLVINDIGEDQYLKNIDQHNKIYAKFLSQNPKVLKTFAKLGVQVDFAPNFPPVPKDKKAASKPNPIIVDEKDKDDEEDKKQDKREMNLAKALKIINTKDAPSIHEYMGQNIIQPALKSHIGEYIARTEFDRCASLIGINTKDSRLHTVLNGAPGTGKTQLITSLSNFLYTIGVIEKPVVVSTTATGLIGQYVGHTAANTRDAIESAKGGILFIDEIYQAAKEDRYGPELITQLLASMEDQRGNLMVVVAGYPEDNKYFLSKNPGLKDRFGAEFYFPDFTNDELSQIIDLNIHKKGLIIQEDAKKAFLDLVLFEKEENEGSFANARTVEKLLGKIITAHAVNLKDLNTQAKFNNLSEIDQTTFKTITLRSVQNVKTQLAKDAKVTKRNGIGFHHQ